MNCNYNHSSKSYLSMSTIIISIPLDTYTESKDTFLQGNPIIEHRPSSLILTYDLNQFAKYADQFNLPSVTIDSLKIICDDPQYIQSYYSSKSSSAIEQHLLKLNSIQLIKFCIDKTHDGYTVIRFLKHSISYPEIWHYLCKLERAKSDGFVSISNLNGVHWGRMITIWNSSSFLLIRLK